MTEAIKKVAAELHEIGGLRRLGDDEGPLPDRIEERCRSFDRIRRTGGNDEELARGGDIGAAEYWRRHETLSRFRVGRLKPLRQGDTDGARGNMDCACEQAADDATVTEHDALDGIVVCQHGNHGIAAAGVRHASGSFRSLRNERFDLRACPVVDGHIVTGFQGGSPPCRRPCAPIR